ncbi:hypothetical protein HYH03_005324 [Edaphochlamys debaryana]|uniref:Uncharacterized protein n=1 Tax=Edaphochlamys debaryana TaxID=47281 RepID=A0A835Y7D8_9CHLO|nr:hypothetical protein HYH03_005324 [Edaphochlamys debaryana]|eukprot:KAG2496499.1 hypothetical protein HYH03_005324 [Edaphochlamys debaryana]
MASLLLPSSRCIAAFKSGSLRKTRQPVVQQRSACILSATRAKLDGSEPSTSASTTPCPSSPRIEAATLAALLASGVLAGSCFAADGPESAAQAVQAAKLASDVLRPLFSIFTVLYIVRIPMTWYPDVDGSKLPWAIAYLPTEATLAATRKVVPLVSGVDVSPIVWVGILSFLNEILLGPQGLLTLVQARGGM